MAWQMDEVASKWQQRWWDAKIHEAERDEQKPSYFIHFAYPGISGYLHVGHMRGFTYTDVFTRYKKQTGFNTIFPAGFHASGIPAVAFAKEVERGEKDEYLRSNGYEGDIQALAHPQAVVDYFAHVYTHDYWKKFGYLIDERRNCTTIDPGYQKFIAWQFRRLHDKGYLIQKPHYAPFCPVAGPVAVDKSETDIKQGGSADINEFVALRFAAQLPDGTDVILPCATLRPETIYGVTNLWAHPEHEYELVRVWKDGAVADSDDSEVWVVSKQGRIKLEWQMERAEGLDKTVAGSDLVGLQATAPITGAVVPVVQGTFVNPDIATGVVMSVPGHAPFDWAAYNDAGLLETLGEPPQIVDIEGYNDLPARVAFEKHNVRDQNDKEALDAATEEVYADEFNKGILNDLCGEFAGKRIKVVKDDLRAAAVEADHGRLIRQFSEPVISRAGEVVDIKRIPDQSFIHYADEAWTEAGKAHAQSMNIYPQRYQDDVTNVLDWFGDRACVRRGAWLGTEFPFKKDWIIEPIADSTFYSWYYLVSPYVNDGRLTPEDLTDEFFDFVVNGRGEAANATWQSVRDDVLHFGPVDINLGGKEHQTVHFPVYIMNNVGLLDDPAMNPRGIYVNWWVTQKAGAKISKSKGGAEPIPGAMAKYGVDPMRLYYCHVGSPHVDIEWDEDIVLSYRNRVERIARTTDDLLALDGTAGPMDAWLEASMQNHVRSARDALEAYDLRTAVNELVYAVAETFRWYQHRGGANGDLARKWVQQWAIAMCPLIPHTAEEMYERAGGEGLCSVQPYPSFSEPDAAVLVAEDYLRAVMEDVHTIAKLADVETPTELVLFTTPAWKRSLTAKAVEMAGGGKFPMGQFMGQVMADPDMRALGKEVQKFTGKLPGDLPKMTPWQKAFLSADLDEATVLQDAAEFIGRELETPVTVWAADATDAPEHPKRNVAAPFKPGIHLA
ncbi:MAG: leucine--tRNA ligase [Thermoplasmatota archaeon]